jgi:hypothetical protein
MIQFQKGVKFVTAVRHEKDEKVIFVEQRPRRALEDYTRWVKAAFPKGRKRGALAAIRTIKKKGFDELQIFTFRDAFQNWKKEDKSRMARESRKARTAKERRSKRKTHKRTAEEQKAFVRDVERVHDREGAKMFIKLGKAQTTKENACPQIPDKHRRRLKKESEDIIEDVIRGGA